VTTGVFVAAIAPHVVWLIRENFPPINWVVTRRTSSSFGDTLHAIVEYLAGTAGYAGAALALALVFLRPARRAIADSWLPRDDRRTAATLFWIPLLLPILAALITKTSLLSLWSTPALNLLPVMMLGSPLVIVPRVAMLRIAGMVTAATLAIVILSPIIAYVILKTGVENHAAYARLVMQAAEREWRHATDKPMTMIAGPFVLVSSAAFYGADKPSTFANFSPYLSPWADAARRKREGMAIMFATGDPDWAPAMEQFISKEQGVRRTEVMLARRWLVFENAPMRFTIAIVPPQ
jgi:hypothetical protein